jgi:1-acyl-sn-glycerol-3-phosphate acyltransferase
LRELRERLLGEPCGFILFPEGGRSRDGRIAAFKPGVGMLVAGTHVPVVPCHLEGTFEALPADRKWPRPTRLTLRVGRPECFDKLPDNRAGWDAAGRVLEGRVLGLAPGGGENRTETNEQSRPGFSP